MYGFWLLLETGRNHVDVPLSIHDFLKAALLAFARISQFPNNHPFLYTVISLQPATSLLILAAGPAHSQLQPIVIKGGQFVRLTRFDVSDLCIF